MALPALPFNIADPVTQAQASANLEYITRHATRLFLEKAMHGLNNYGEVGAGEIAFRNVFLNSYLPAMLSEEVDRAFVELKDHAGDFDRMYTPTQEPVSHVVVSNNVAISDTAPVTNPVSA